VQEKYFSDMSMLGIQEPQSGPYKFIKDGNATENGNRREEGEYHL